MQFSGPHVFLSAQVPFAFPNQSIVHHIIVVAQISTTRDPACRWCIATDTEPRDMERRLLDQVDYAANFQHNGGRRPFVMLPQSNRLKLKDVASN